MVEEYIPECGDIVWLDFNPQTGNEHKGTRPALALSPKIYNQKSGLCVFVPITSKIKGYPFEVILQGEQINGAILSDQIKSLDYRVRRAKFCEKIDSQTLSEVREKISLLVL